jgi:hypothetical protein
MTLSALGIFSAAGAGGVQGDYELIETYILGSSQASITFSNLANFSSTYKHLQLRYAARTSDTNASVISNYSRFNADSGSNYNGHFLLGNGSTVSSGAIGTTTGALSGIVTSAANASSVFGSGVIELLDTYAAKNKTVRTLSGTTGTGQNRVDLHSGLWMNTASLTSWNIRPELGSYIAGSRFSLYGIRG